MNKKDSESRNESRSEHKSYIPINKNDSNSTREKVKFIKEILSKLSLRSPATFSKINGCIKKFSDITSDSIFKGFDNCHHNFKIIYYNVWEGKVAECCRCGFRYGVSYGKSPRK